MSYRKIFSFILLAFALALFFLLTGSMDGTAQAADPTWTARYWNNRTLSGSPVLERQEAQLNNDWGLGSPQPGVVSPDNFSASWQRAVNFSGGAVTFTATADDGIRVWVDNTLIIDAWQESAVRSISANTTLSAGDHQIRVEYFEAGAAAVAKLTWTGGGGSSPGPVPSWRGEYYNNTGLSGSPAHVRNDASIDFDWGVGAPAPGVGADNFSVRWTNTLPLQSGNYRFTATADDGVRLWVNGQLIIDQWHDAYEGTYTAEIDIPGSAADVRMEYYENVGGALARLAWVRLGASSGGSGAWRGEYYNNRSLSGSPALVRNDAGVNFNWGTGSPAPGTVDRDNFSVRWTNSVSLNGGIYRFTATSDDGVRVWANNQLIIDAWNDHAPTTYNADVSLPGGAVPIRVEYYENTGNALVNVYWTLTSAEPAPSPTPVPSPAPSGAYGIVQSARLNIRYGPGLQYGVVAQLQQGDRVNLTGYRADHGYWVMINWQGQQLWVSGHPSYLALSVPITSLTVWTGSIPGTGGPGPGPTATVFNCQYLNVRSSPMVANNVVTVIPAGTIVRLLGRSANSAWAKIQLVNGTVGWSSTTYLDESVSVSSLPVVQ